VLAAPCIPHFISTREYESSWIFEPCLTCANVLRRVRHPGFSLGKRHIRLASEDSKGLVTLEPPCHGGGRTYGSVLAVQVCVLQPLCRRLTQMEHRTRQATSLVTAVHKHRGATGSQIASQHRMCSLDGRCLIARHDDQRFRWSEPMWSPPPESNRRPHPYHGTPGTAVRTAVSPGHARPSGPKLSVLLRPSYAFTDHRALIISGAGRNHTGSCWVGGGCDPNRGSQSAVATAGLAIGPLERFEQVNSPITGPLPPTLRRAIRFRHATAARVSAQRPGRWNSATGPASGARRTPPARTPPAGPGC
jgi:hypothetical protein